MNIFFSKRIIFIIFFSSFNVGLQFALHAQMEEICDNAIDDDGDGLIDLNDDDCKCPIELPTSLIPNPSFEEQRDCPMGEGLLLFAEPWIQASAATTDYMHECGGFLSHPVVTGDVFTPMPDGQGCVGFRNGRPGQGGFKEYTGTRLLQPLEAGTLYSLNMWVGFLENNTSSPEFELTVFGAEQSSANDGILPFGNGDPQIGCPLNVQGYEQLGSTFVSGQDEWVNTTITFRTERDLNVIVIGPNCAPNPFAHYYFFDNLILQKTVEFGEQPSITGHPCMNNVQLELPLLDEETYQWYKDGVAIIGETNSDYNIPQDQLGIAVYQLMVTTDTICKLSAPYTFEIPKFETINNITICDNEPLQLSNQEVLSDGTFTELLSSVQNCDSTVITNVTLLPSYDIFFSDTICSREVYILGEQVLDQPGIFTEFFRTVEGCDSVVTVELFVRPSIVTVDAQGDKRIRLGERTPIRAVVSDISKVQEISWVSSDSLIAICDTCIYQLVSPTQTTTYTLRTFDTRGCDVTDNVTVEVDEFYEAYFPNTFSPNGDGVNDFYFVQGTNNVAQILSFNLFDRWGNQVFQNQNFDINEELSGWNGRFRDEDASQGVYVYTARVEFLDGNIALFQGDIVLVR